jgi:hypothetical protein
MTRKRQPDQQISGSWYLRSGWIPSTKQQDKHRQETKPQRPGRDLMGGDGRRKGVEEKNECNNNEG